MIEESTLRAVLDLMDIGMAIVDTDRRVEWCNVAYADLVNRSVDELTGASIFEGARPCDELTQLESEWGTDRMLTLSGQGPVGPVDVSVRPVRQGSADRLVVVRRGLVRPVGGRRLPDEVVEELCSFVTEMTGHAADPMVLATAPLSILMVMIAEGEGIRAAHGETAVEDVLRQVAQALVLQKRKADVIARYREGQFLVLAPDTSRVGASMLAERIRRSVAGIELQYGGERLRATVLTFAAEYRPRMDGSVRDAVEKASSHLQSQAFQIVS